MRKVMLALAATSLALPVMDAPAVARGYYYQGKVWRDSHGRLRCKRSNGTTGLIVGAAAGGLFGNIIAGRRSSTVGTLLGAIAGGAAGASIDRNQQQVRCR